MPDMLDDGSNNRPRVTGQPDDGLSQLNPSATDQIVRRGQEAMERKRRGFEDWMDIAEALQVGRAESMRTAQTNEAKGKRYEKVMGDWLLARGFHLIDKGTRRRLLDCLKNRTALEKWRATLTEGQRFSFNHPDTVLRKWKAATVVPDPNAPPKKPSPMAKYKAVNIELQEKLHRAEQEIARGGGDLWNKDDRAEDIAEIMLVKLSTNKAEKVARAILARLKEQRKSTPVKSAAKDAAASAEERKAVYAAEESSAC